MKTADRARYAAVRDAARMGIALGIGGRWELPGGGLVAIERPLPFFVTARLGEDDALLHLTGGVAARAVTSSRPGHVPAVRVLEAALLSSLAARWPRVLVVRVVEARGKRSSLRARLASDPRWDALEAPIARALAEAELGPIAIERADAEPLPCELDGGHACVLDLEVRTAHRDAAGKARYPMRLYDASRALARALAAVADEFASFALPAVRPRPRLGAARMDEAAQAADRALAQVDDAFDVLVQLTPANLDAMWRELVESDFTKEPVIEYRPLPFDPMRIKRALFEAPVEDVEDPILADLLREKQEELDRMLSMLRDRGETFLHESRQLYGSPRRSLVVLAERMLAVRPGPRRADEPLRIDAILARARAHMHAYRDQDPLFPDEIELRDDIVASIMVLHGRLLVRNDIALAPRRLAALLEHEIGTHVLTWFNGSAQSLRLLGRGLAGYEGLQEGLAVLAEHLAGTLDPERLRVLAARVVAAHAVGEGASFLEIFRRLHGGADLDARSAFQTTVRAVRGGGMTKDMVYLEGLRQVIEHLSDGGAIMPLYSGKLALRHLDAVSALVDRGMLSPPRVVPIVLRTEAAGAKLDAIRSAADPDAVLLGLAQGEEAQDEGGVGP